jgi:hypothetical protein
MALSILDPTGALYTTVSQQGVVDSHAIRLHTCPVYKTATDSTREDDVSWPKKNIVGRQELEVRIDKEHISFEVSCF